MAIDFADHSGHAGRMESRGPRSPYDAQDGMVYFPRMVDKIRLRQAGALSDDYVANLGRGFDLRCCQFLRVDYEELVSRVAEGGDDAAVLAWCHRHGRQPGEAEVFMWNEYLRKCGWNDEYSTRLRERLAGLGLSERADIQTMFDLIEVDEGREPRGG